MSLHIAILYGSVREARAGIRLVRFLDGALRRRGHETSVVDAAEYRLPLLDRMYKEYARGTAPPVLERLAELYRRVDSLHSSAASTISAFRRRSRTCSTISSKNISSGTPPSFAIRRDSSAASGPR